MEFNKKCDIFLRMILYETMINTDTSEGKSNLLN